MGKVNGSINLTDLARLGASMRLGELRSEQALILKAFPDIDAPRPRRRKKRLSAEARAAISKRMRNYWKQARQKKTRAAASA